MNVVQLAFVYLIYTTQHSFEFKKKRIKEHCNEVKQKQKLRKNVYVDTLYNRNNHETAR